MASNVAGIPRQQDLLYHYTDAGGLMGILESQRLWASNAAYLNDPTELLHARSVYREWLEPTAAVAGPLKCAVPMRRLASHDGGNVPAVDVAGRLPPLSTISANDPITAGSGRTDWVTTFTASPCLRAKGGGTLKTLRPP
jgi:hypothetical protein